MSAIPKVSGSLVNEKLKRLGSIFSTIEKMAIVGDLGLMDIYAKIVDQITRFNVKHFTVDQRDKDLDWLKE